MGRIFEEIIKNADPVYKNFQEKLVPTIPKHTVLGVRAPLAQAIAKQYANTDEGKEFLHDLPHKYYDENVVHAYMLGKTKGSTEELESLICEFLPYVDNWAVCDGLCAHLKNFFKKPNDVYDFVVDCTKSSRVYTVRFGLVCLLDYYIDNNHISEIIEICKSIKSQEYYVNMALSWLISFLLIKQYKKSVVLIERDYLSKWVHNKSIQKACESYRVDNDTKKYLRSLYIK